MAMSYDAEEMLSPQLVQDELQRVVVSRDFMHSKRKRRFLKYVVQETLAGRADRIKAYTIAVDAFDRDPSFDPLADPVVRIEAGRLRRCLEHYYLAEGTADRIPITVALLQATDNQYLWSDRFCQEFSPGKMIGVRHDIALQGARVLAQPHGGIDNEKVRTLAGIPPEPLAYRNVCFQ
jgi:hypothetical protein